MASFDLDPIFLKGLRLLHSKAKDSADQLRQLLEDVLSHKHNSSLPVITPREKGYLSTNRLETESKNAGSKKSSPRHSNESSSQSSSKSSLCDEPKKKEAEKRHFEKLNQELSELFNYDTGTKRSRLLPGESPRSSLSSSPSPQPNTIKIEEQPFSATPSAKSEFMDSIAMLAATASGGPTDAEDFAMEMGLVCIVCKQLEVTLRNQLIECQECHSLYHQECHRPPVTDTEVNDPRHVWYCIRCTKNMRKATKSQKTSVKSSTATASMRETVASNKTLKAVELPSPATPSLLPFKRSELKASGVSQSGGLFHGASTVTLSNKPTGLASLAANFSSRSPATSTLATATSASKTGFGNKGGLSSLANSKLPSSFPSVAAAGSSTSKGGKPSPSALVSLASSVSKSVTAPTRSTSTAATAAPVGANSGGNGGNSGKTSSTSSSLMSADKRLQIMKKKAAQKMQEKRRLSSK